MKIFFDSGFHNWRRFFLAICTGLLLLTCADENKMFEKPLSPRIANYTIECSYDPATNIISGSEILEWKNTSPDTVRELQFHLYMNAFADSASTFLQEYGEVPQVLSGNWGRCEIKQISRIQGADLTESMRFIQPDDENVHDKTVASVQLDALLTPRRAILLKIDFETTLPPLVERAGYHGNFHLATQWFPKIGVYTKNGWNCHQYHSNSEFFADFGVYDVKLSLPDSFTVGATGILRSETALENGQTQYHFYAEDVHDFAWCADADAEVFTDTSDSLNIRLICQPEHREMANRFIHAVQVGHQYFEERYGDYPYPQVTIVDAPLFSAVMEYPMFFMTGNFDGINNAKAKTKPVPIENKFPERLTLHELGHNWWFGMVANNEFEEAWLDEGITEYVTAKAFEAAYGKIMQPDADGNPLPVRNFRKDRYLANPQNLPTLLNSWEYPTFGEYYVASYVKPKLMLYTLDNHLGEEVMEKVIHTFFQRWQFRHPTTADFIETTNEIIGKDWMPFFNQYLGSSASLDFFVGDVTQDKAIIRKSGELIFPVEIKLTFADGDIQQQIWQAEGDAFLIPLQKSLAKIDIDPQAIIEFELDKKNNQWEK